MEHDRQAYHLAQVILRQLQGQPQQGDQEALDAWLAAEEANRRLFTELTDDDRLQHKARDYHAYELAADNAWQTVASRISKKRPPTVSIGRKVIWRAAAILVLALGAALLWQWAGPRQKAVAPAGYAAIQPGTVKAQLTLANGSVITLNAAGAREMKEEDGTRIKSHAGSLEYDKTMAGAATILYNTLSTQRGGTYQLLLPDGSRVWLNAASSLRYPTRFTGPERKVFLTGEAFFEINRDAAHPFKVEMDDNSYVEVLGTKFNVMAYADEEAIRTTLVEGSVKAGRNGSGKKLLPGQQAVTARTGNSVDIIESADVEQAIAWKNGYFYFDNEQLPYIMRQLSRWYDVEIVYAGGQATQHYYGAIKRKEHIGQVLEKIELAGGVKFNIEGGKVIVQTQPK